MTKAHSIVNKLNLSATALALMLATGTHTGIAVTQVATVGTAVSEQYQSTCSCAGAKIEGSSGSKTEHGGCHAQEL